MPSKIKIKQETGGAAQPDQVMTTLQKTYATLDKFKMHLIFGFVGIVVILLGVSWFLSYREGSQKDVAKSFFDAFRYASAPVGEDAKPVGSLPAFKTEAEKNAKLTTELEAFVADNGDTHIGPTAQLALAAVHMETEKFQEAYDVFASAVEREELAALKPILLENLAFAALRLGKFDEAEKRFNEMRDSSPNPFIKARALVHLGDMANPGTASVATAKDAQKARDFYKQATDLFPENPEAADDLTALFKLFDPAKEIRSSVQVRLALLAL